MDDIVSAVFSFFIKAIFFAAMIFVPVLIVIFIFATWQTAKLYSIDVALLIGLSYSILDSDSRPSDFMESKITLVCFLVGITAVLAHTGMVVYQQRQISAQQVAYQSAQSKATDPNESFCYGIGEQYGRAAARGMDGRDVKPADDVVIPERCRNLEATSLGIRAGIRMESQR